MGSSGLSKAWLSYDCFWASWIFELLITFPLLPVRSLVSTLINSELIRLSWIFFWPELLPFISIYKLLSTYNVFFEAEVRKNAVLRAFWALKLFSASAVIYLLAASNANEIYWLVYETTMLFNSDCLLSIFFIFTSGTVSNFTFSEMFSSWFLLSLSKVLKVWSDCTSISLSSGFTCRNSCFSNSSQVGRFYGGS